MSEEKKELPEGRRILLAERGKWWRDMGEGVKIGNVGRFFTDSELALRDEMIARAAHHWGYGSGERDEMRYAGSEDPAQLKVKSFTEFLESRKK